MATLGEHPRMAQLDEAVDHLTRLAAARPSEAEQRQLEAARDWLAAYAVAARHLAGTGVSTSKLEQLIDRGCREARLACQRADAERADQHHLLATS